MLALRVSERGGAGMSERYDLRRTGRAVTALTRAAGCSFLALLLSTALSVQTAEAQVYLLHDLGQTHMYNDRQGINNAGQVVYSRGMQGELDRAFIFDREGERELSVPTR